MACSGEVDGQRPGKRGGRVPSSPSSRMGFGQTVRPASAAEGTRCSAAHRAALEEVPAHCKKYPVLRKPHLSWHAEPSNPTNMCSLVLLLINMHLNKLFKSDFKNQ